MRTLVILNGWSISMDPTATDWNWIAERCGDKITANSYEQLESLICALTIEPVVQRPAEAS